jgi:hypothetical protein
MNKLNLAIDVKSKYLNEKKKTERRDNRSINIPSRFTPSLS